MARVRMAEQVLDRSECLWDSIHTGGVTEMAALAPSAALGLTNLATMSHHKVLLEFSKIVQLGIATFPFADEVDK